MNSSELCRECGAAVPHGSHVCAACSRGIGEPPPSSGSYTPHHLIERVLVSRSAVEGEKKLVTVLFADVAGFSALAERLDPEAVHAIMDGCFEILTRSVHRYEGTVNQFTGDGIMALFGAPVAHEDHAVRALRSALAIRESLLLYDAEVQRRWQVPFRMRVGVNSGTVVVGSIGDNLRMDYTAVGDTTNLAARLQQSAPAGAIWVGEATHRLGGNEFAWERLEPGSVRGREGSVVAYELVEHRHPVPNKFDEPSGRGLTPLVARERELQQIEAAWAQARLGRGGVVSIVGEAGLGKTRLLHEFKRNLGSGPPSIVCEGSCFAHGDTSSYMPFRDVLKSLFKLEGIHSESEAARSVARVVEDLGLDSTSVAAPILNVLSYPIADKTFRALPANLVRERTVSALRAVIRAVAARQPMVLVIEDLHWIDQATEEVVSALVNDAEALNLLLVFVFRPEYLHTWGDRANHSRIALARLPSPSSAEMVRAVLHRPHAIWVALRQLSQDQSAEMVRQILDSKVIPPELDRLVAQATDGNPLFIEEFLLSLIEGGELTRREDHWVLKTSPEALKLPRTLQSLFLARVDRLNDELKEVLQVASVIGRVFSFEVLAEASRRGARVESALGDLEELELVYRQADTLPPMYSFKHVLSQQAIYDSLLRSKQERHHEDVGRAIESLHPDRLNEHCELLAFHYERSANINKAVEYLHQANRKSIGVSAMADAQNYFERANNLLKLLPGDTHNNKRRLELVLDQVFVALALFKYREYRELLGAHASLAETLGDRRLLGAFLARVGWCQWSMGDFAPGIETLDRAAEQCTAAGNDDDLGLALMTRAWCELARGDLEPALLTCEASLGALGRKFDLQSYLRTRAAASALNGYLGRWNLAIAEGKKAVEIGEQYGDGGATSFAAMVATWSYAFMGDLVRALDMADFAVKKAVSPADSLFARGSRALVECKMGQAAEAAEVLAEVVTVIRSMRFPACETFGLYFCEALWRAGELAKARVALGECLGVVEPCGMQFYAASAKRLLGEVELAEGGDRLSAAAGHFEESMTVLEAVGAQNELALAWAGYGRLRKEIGDRAGSRDYLIRALGSFERLGTLIEPDNVRRTLAELG
jgi:class 3 adenylate cyclase/tetratricopeptide (TPR) repeat protein